MTTFIHEEEQNERLREFKKKEEEDLIKMLSTRYGLNYIDLQPVTINSEAVSVIPEALAREGKLAIFDKVGKRLQVAVFSPKYDKTALILRQLVDQGYAVNVSMASTASLEKAWKIYQDLRDATASTAGTFDIGSDNVVAYMAQIKKIADVSLAANDSVNVKKAYRISKIMEVLIAGALALNASDIHLEPEEETVRVRFRLDGVLIDVLTVDIETYNLILSRIKLLSGLKLNIKAESQDGRFSVKIKDNDIEIRTSVLPSAYAETIVMRLLNPKSIAVTLGSLGIEERTLKVLLEQISRPKGMILITGPTGSGKTTTLYAFMSRIYSPDIKIITIEDPIEYHLKGIVQTQTEEEKGYTFLSGLRAALRQDPDVIMVGEIRDSETAGIAINAALTGHLVFSTLHTNTAAGAFPRLIDLGVNSKIISSALNAAMAQRLIRKLCETCKKEKVLEGDSKKIVDEILDSIYDKTYLEGIQREKVFEAVGCEECNQTGYRGRVSICEVILIDQKVEDVINMNPSDHEIREAARPQNLLDMRQDGLRKCLRGISTLDELGRVVDLRGNY